MKGVQLLHRIRKKNLKIDKALKRVIIDFNKEDIHRFRLKVKKLRSFLRLANVDLKGKSQELTIPRKLHAFYNAIGVIRSLQLQQQSIAKLNLMDYAVLAKPYLDFIACEIKKRMKLTRKLLHGKATFSKGTRRILKSLPLQLKRKSIGQFTSKKLHVITSLMEPASLSDESLHTVRKLLKDIVYTWPFTEEHTAFPAVVIMDKKQINFITKILGEFQDKCAGLNLLNEHYRKQQISQSEREVWRTLENKWWAEKELARAEIHRLFEKEALLRLNPSHAHSKFALPLMLD